MLGAPDQTLLGQPALKHPGPGGPTGVGVDAAICGCSLDVGEAQELRVHQVPGAKVLVVAAAGGITGEGVAAGGAGGLISRLGEGGRGGEREGEGGKSERNVRERERGQWRKTKAKGERGRERGREGERGRER